MKRIEFEIRVANYLEEESRELVSGYEVRVQGFEDFKFAAHQKFDFREVSGGWHFTELSSGCSVVQGRATRKEAIEDGIKLLNTSSPTGLAKKIKDKEYSFRIS